MGHDSVLQFLALHKPLHFQLLVVVVVVVVVAAAAAVVVVVDHSSF